MCKFRYIIFFLSVFFTGYAVKAQENLQFSFRYLNQADGMIHNQVYGMAQDAKGFIWMATASGLQRYDGSRFVYYPEMLSDPLTGITYGANMISDNEKGQLLILKNSSLEIIDRGNMRARVYDAQKMPGDTAFRFTSYPYGKDSSWLLSSHALFLKINSAGTTNLFHLNVMADKKYESANFINIENGNSTWATANSRLLLFDKKSGVVFSKKNNPEKHPLLEMEFSESGTNSLRLVMEDGRHNIWVTTWGDLFYRYDEKTRKIIRYSLAAIKRTEDGVNASVGGLLINSILEDDAQNIWVATENAGLLRYNSAKDCFDYCIGHGNRKEGVRYSYNIYNIFQDKERNIWVCTDKGISIFNPYQQYFSTIRHEETNPLSISKSEIESFIQLDDGSAMVGTWGGGTAVYDKDLHFKKNLLFTDNTEKNFVWSFLQTDARTLWIGCQHGYLMIYDLVMGKVKQTLHPAELESSTILCMEKDSGGNIWLGLHNGKIIQWDAQAGKFLPYPVGGPDSLKPGAPVFNLLIQDDQHAWVSTDAGFKEFDLEKRWFTKTWLPVPGDPGSISGVACRGMETLNDSIILIGTSYGGLNFFNKHSRKFTHLNIGEGFPSNTVYALKKDTAGYIWFTTDYGLYKFHPADKKFFFYSMEPGTINAAFVSTRFYLMKDASWVTFTPSELVSFLPASFIPDSNSNSKVEITGFRIFDEPVLIDSLLLENAPVDLSYKDNFFSIEFAALNFPEHQQTTYYYRLKGVDNDWVAGGTKRSANYTDLQPGTYIFEVKTGTSSTNGPVTSFTIIIKPPFWKTSWFLALGFILIAGIVYMAAKLRFNIIRREAKGKLHFARQMAEMEMDALRSQLNPHFIFNCINSIDALIQSNDKYNATVYLNKFAKLLRNIMDSNKHNTVPFSKDIDTLKLYIELEELRHENKFTTTYDIDNELLNSDYKVPPLIIQPFVENAILHGIKNRETNGGLLAISIRREGDQIRYTITDNGIGREASGKLMQNKESHYGMQISYDRVKLFNKEDNASVTIKDLYQDGDPAGTEVKVNLNIY